MLPTIAQRLATELAVGVGQVEATLVLLDEGASVPFVARYRKEATGGLDDTQLRYLAERLIYLRELEARRASILDSIRGQNQLTPALEAAIQVAEQKQTLEDLYLPYKPKRRTKAQIAREAGLTPLAEALLADPTQDPATVALAWLRPEAGFTDAKMVLDGARQILMERCAESAPLLGQLRDLLQTQGQLTAQRHPDAPADKAEKFRDYFDYQEPLARIPSHRLLALLRGRNEEVLQLTLLLPDVPAAPFNAAERLIAQDLSLNLQGNAADKWLQDTVRLTWRAKLSLHLELELLQSAREHAETEAIRVFGANLRDVLLAAPAGAQVTMGIDPGLRTGVKIAIVDATGKLCATDTLYPHPPQRDWAGSLVRLRQWIDTYKVTLIAIGNGTASRETDAWVAELFAQGLAHPVQKVTVSEAGASVYSASALAAEEFPGLDVSLRGAVSIARRLQDPLAELVKIEPKAIGVGQYQHDVNQAALARALDAVVEDCVNAVGVDVNTASVPLLTRVAGLSAGVAKQIVAFREANGAFGERAQLYAVPRLGAKTFEQAAGFLRIRGNNPLDASAVHPEAYPVVEAILQHLQQPLTAVLGNTAVLRQLNPKHFITPQFGLPTVQDILRELEKPGRDPRPAFVTARFNPAVTVISDVKVGMILEGVVSNVANFGAFVDLGVHQDGLIHVSALSERFVQDPRTVVKAGDVVRVKVISVDVARQRIGLSLRLQDEVATSPPEAASRRAARTKPPATANKPQGALAAALSRLKRGA